MHRLATSIVAATLISACHLSISLPTDAGTGTSPPADAGATANTLVIDVHRTGSTVTIDNVRAYDSPAALAPRPGGDYVLVASSGGKAVAAVSFAFPTTMVSEGPDENGQLVGEETDISDDTVASVLLPNGAYDSLTVLDASGATVAAQAAGLSLTSAALTAEIGRTAQPLLAGPLKGKAQYAGAPGLIFLEPEDQPRLPAKIQAQLLPVGGLQSFSSLPAAAQASILAGLADTAAAPLEAVSYIAFVHYNATGGVVDGASDKAFGQDFGGIVVLNADKDLTSRFAETSVVHEAAHAYTQALGEVGTAAQNDWPQDVQDLAKVVVSQFPFPEGFKVFWYKMQKDWVASSGLAGDYVGSGWQSVSDPTAKAFVRSYGASNPAEDIATYVEQLAPNAPVTAYFCSILQGLASAGTFPVKLTPPLVKALLLTSVGFISPTDYVRCVGPSPPLQGSLGFRFMDGNGNDQYDFTDHLDGVSGSAGATLSGSDQTNGAVTAAVSSRFGLTRLTGGSLASVSLSGLGWNATDGLALLVPSDPGTIAVAAFNVELTSTSGSTKLSSFAQFTVKPMSPKMPTTTFPFVTSCLIEDTNGQPEICYDEYGKLTQYCTPFDGAILISSDMPCPTDNLFGSCDDGEVLPGADQIRRYYSSSPGVSDPGLGLSGVYMSSCINAGSTWIPAE